MGGSMSSGSLYRTVAIVEVITSLVITIFGVNTFLLFQQQNDMFRTEKEMIFYSSIVAVVQSLLTILSSVFLVGCHQTYPAPMSVASQWWTGENGDQPRLPPSQVGQPNTLRLKAVAPTWISWTTISIACLLFVFIAPIHYCIQAPSDIEKLQYLAQRPDGSYIDTIDNKPIGFCYSTAPEVMPIRNSLRDLYSFSFIGLMFKSLFCLMIYRNWKREQERAKKIIIYNEKCRAAYSPEGVSPETEPKIVVSSYMGPDGDGGGDCGTGGDGEFSQKKGAELDDKVKIV